MTAPAAEGRVENHKLLFLLSHGRNYHDEVMTPMINRDNDGFQRAGMQSERLTGGNIDERAAGTRVT